MIYNIILGMIILGTINILMNKEGFIIFEEIIYAGIGIVLIFVIIIMNNIAQEIKKTNILLNKIAKKLGVPEPCEDSIIKTFVAEGKKVEGVKRYREIAGGGLKEAHEYIEKLMQAKDIKSSGK
ncbi:MAG TPA: 50S ribosomal protein L7/L12 [Acetivibrio saccincola]|uniref:50S ribosomal protein L7/L12 n=1 Tax=Acetivibrio saccincola TaxID=1677857 RepID=UPI002D05EFEE|nr:50S ribosomal protein L7/L12 [Acetivibrio saccincola]HOA98072.1 50S ribosomal protein L7/L12 [Acetivibrio saccincola]